MICKIIYAIIFLTSSLSNNFDLSIIGNISKGDGIWGIPIQVIDCLSDSNIKLNWFTVDDNSNLKNLTEKKKNLKKSNKFIFGNTQTIIKRKNHIKLIEGFAKAFQNNSNVILKINTKGFEDETFKLVQQKLDELKAKNIEITCKFLSNEEY